jgi:monolysocardiolipin acyltransferase
VFSRADTPIFLSIAKRISIGATTLAIRLFMNSYGEYKVVDDQHYAHFLSLVLGESGRSDNNQSLITVSNHRSLFDDPGVVSLVLPLWIGLQPKYNRYGICSQEYCFADILPSFIKGYIGAGQVLPIWRGGGIEQALLKDFGKLIAMGEWCHIFPEGGE